MKVLNKHDKDIYDTLMSVVKFEKIDCSNVEIPKGWIDNIYKISRYD